MNVPSVGSILDSKELNELFKAQQQGGIRVSKKNNCIVLIMDPSQNMYDDKWEGNILHYVGSGQKGDQEMKGPNKTLANSKEDGKEIHVFEKLRPNQYFYRGSGELVYEPYKENQNGRNVLVFPIKIEYSKAIE